MNGMGCTGEGQTSTCCYCCSSVTCPMICTLTKALSLKTAQSNNNINNIMDSSYKEQISLQNKNSMHLDTPFMHVHINRHILYGHTNNLPRCIYICIYINTKRPVLKWKVLTWVLNSKCAAFADWQKAKSRQKER